MEKEVLIKWIFLLSLSAIGGVAFRGLFLQTFGGGFKWADQRWQFITASLLAVLASILMAWVGLKGWIGVVIMLAAGFLSYYWMNYLNKKRGS